MNKILRFNDFVNEAKKYKLGAMYSSDFDYGGMLDTVIKFKLTGNTVKDIKTLTKLHNSLEDVNYSTVASFAWDILEMLKSNDFGIGELEAKVKEFNLAGEAELLKESMINESVENPKLIQAAGIIASFLNKKLKNDYKVVKSFVYYNGIPGIMMYSNKGNSGVLVSAPEGKGVGIVGSLSYFSDFAASEADLVITSEQFPIVKLLGEFVLLISNPSYAQELQSTITEGMDINEAINLPASQIKEIEKLLNTGMSVAKIAKQLGIPYGHVYKFKSGVPMAEQPSQNEIKNEETLADKAKFLNETLEDIYAISRRIAAGAPNMNSLLIAGRAGTGKSFMVEKAMKDEGLVEDVDFFTIKGGVSAIETYKKLYQFNDKVLIFDDADGIFADQEGRNIMKGALDTRKERRLSWLKKSKDTFDPLTFEDPEDQQAFLDNGQVPNTFLYTGRVIFISNLSKEKADPDGAIRSRSILIDVNPDDATLMERMRILLPELEPKDMPLKEKEEIFEFMKKAKDISMRTFVKAAGFKQAGLANWERMAKRYL